MHTHAHTLPFTQSLDVKVRSGLLWSVGLEKYPEELGWLLYICVHRQKVPSLGFSKGT